MNAAATPNAAPTPPALPDAATLQTEFAGTRWRTVEVVAQTGSTNADLVDRAVAGESIDGVVRIAGQQTAGRGRHTRVWETPPGQLAISAAIAVTPGDEEALGWLSLLTGLAVRQGIAAVTGINVDLKWPNDILVPGATGTGPLKLAGILSEFRPDKAVAVIGTGINLDLTGLGSDADIPTAACLRSLTGAPVDATAIAAGYLSALSDLLAQWPAQLESLRAQYRDACATLGTPVRLILPGNKEVIGEAIEVDEQGRIVVDGPAGPVAAAAGDVTHLRSTT